MAHGENSLTGTIFLGNIERSHAAASISARCLRCQPIFLASVSYKRSWDEGDTVPYRSGRDELPLVRSLSRTEVIQTDRVLLFLGELFLALATINHESVVVAIQGPRTRRYFHLLNKSPFGDVGGTQSEIIPHTGRYIPTSPTV